MTTESTLPTVTLAVGQHVKVALNISGDVPDALWVDCDHPSIVTPALANGTPLAWPQLVPLTSGTGSFFMHGVSVGAATYAFYADSACTAPSLIDGVVEVLAATAGQGATAAQVDIHLMAIAEPIAISITVIKTFDGPV